MTQTITAVFDGKVFHPEESVELEANVRCRLTVAVIPTAKNQSKAWKEFLAMAGTIEGPEDWSEEHDHYLYGTPKRKKKRPTK